MARHVFNSANIASVLHMLANDMEGHSEELRQLDAVFGDGDLGITVELGSRALRECLAHKREDDMGQLLARCGLSINKASPSTFGTLLASAYLSAGKAVSGKEDLGKDDFISMAEGAIEGIKRRGKADVGDKTMLDCLVPATNTFKGEIERGSDISEALDAAVMAAERGLKSTSNMISKYGRASLRREETVGVQDAGATAMYYMIKSFAQHLQDEKSSAG